MSATPINVVPVWQAMHYNGSNHEEILSWSKADMIDLTPEYLEVWRIKNAAAFIIPVDHWAVATLADPPLLMDAIPDDVFRARHAMHPGPVEPVAAPIDSTPDPESDPEPEPEGGPA